MGEWWTGHDPGSVTGAIGTMSDPEAVEFWAVFTKVSRGYRVRMSCAEEHTLLNLFEASMFIRQCLPESRLVVEAMFEARARRGKKIAQNSSTKCAEACGEFLGPIRSRAIGRILRPPSDMAQKGYDPPWRKKVFGNFKMSGDRAENMAVELAEKFTYPEGARPLGRASERDVTLTLAEEGALAESLMMAVYGFKSESV